MKTKINFNRNRLVDICAAIALMLIAHTTFAQQGQDPTYKKFYVGSSMFMLANLNTSDPNAPDFAQLNVGYRITPKDVASIEVKTWKYAWPLGIPYGNSYEAPEEKYPGYVRSYGFALVYQRFLWKGAYAAVHGMNSFQKYVDDDNNPIQNGYMLFMTYRVGYHIKLFKNRFFIEPSVAMTHWPINTNVPEPFAALERKWNNYFLPEPGLHFGFKF
jgi:hypothetical protein